jgi:hypothetical protein
VVEPQKLQLAAVVSSAPAPTCIRPHPNTSGLDKSHRQRPIDLMSALHPASDQATL